MSIPSQNDILLPFLKVLNDGHSLTRGYKLAMYGVLGNQWAIWLNPPPADPSVAHSEERGK